MESYLSLRKQCIRINDACSSFLDCNIGVPQGSVLGPILFSLYININDLPTTVCPEVQVQMYADDTVVYTYAKIKEQAAIKLTAALNKVSDVILTLNVSKTVGMCFSIKKVDEHCPDILVKGEVINIVYHFKYLGMIMDSKLHFKKH